MNTKQFAYKHEKCWSIIGFFKGAFVKRILESADWHFYETLFEVCWITCVRKNILWEKSLSPASCADSVWIHYDLLGHILTVCVHSI